MKRWTEKQKGAAALAAIALAVGVLSGKTVPGRVEDDSQVAPVPGHVAALGTVKASDAATSAPAGPTGIGAPRAASPAPAVEYVARWSQLLRFETEDERSERVFRSDPFLAVEALPALLAHAARDDSEAAFHLYRLAEYCEAHPEAEDPPPDYLPLDCSAPKSWSKDQRRAWRRQAVFTGDPSPAMSMLKDAEFIAATDPHRSDAISDAVMSLDYAARRGCLECIVVLSEIHRDGVLVQQDLRRSFAYLQVAAAASGESFYAQQAESLRPSLRPIDIDFARALQERLAKALEKNKAR